ncbi:SusC/RagA family TonB-linked outer membrane protein [Neolewinella lacunae]|uniref:SusC/RagA family TonB-linked outer membrane protein n=1 Tax=Neolewinella lacunae TaxID=1517758 RepID=A0A923PPU1_9BACT|nr:SusC/RagA family TonB-linked outer membrane protein [Neolewinella lacunae]MBC6994507.1 SusC/RagA family TonB-linked outer membrane protein [Neolewinella lacunae]MDN3634200.1 SusC/RagA family TonB-linked outer membrane protein [Neolewinella lacunae]
MRLLLLVLLLCGFTALQAQAITGKITDPGGEPLIGASVLAKGSTSGTVTDLDGNFALTLPANTEFLVVTYTGFTTQEVPVVAGLTNYSITLSESSTVLEQVVVTGYGSTTRRRLTTSIASVGTEAFDNVPITSFENALQGRLPGVTINSNSGTLGAQTSVRVRGVGSINSDNQPLYVVDGVIMESTIEGLALGGPGTNPLVNINPADIASVDVLKDAASAAIYGSRGSNGVIIITTKSGDFNQKAKVSVNSYIGFTNPTNQYELLTGPQYAELWNRAFLAGGGSPTSTDLYANPAEEPDAQWLDLVTQQGQLQETSASVSGGTNTISYFLGGTYRDEDGWVTTTNLKRYSLRLNLEAKLGDKWRAGLNLNPTRTVNNRQNEDNNVASPQTYAALAFPNLNPFDENGNTRGGIIRTSTGRAQFAGNPLINLEGQNISLTTSQVLAKTFLEFNPISSLKIRSEFGTQYLNLTDFQKSSSLTTDGFGSGGTGQAQNQEVLNYTWDNTATYLVDFGRSTLDLLAGFSVQNNVTNTLNVNGNTFADDRLLTLNSAAEITGGGGFNTAYRFVGYLARASYSFDDKLFFNVSARYDGSSRFGRDNLYGLFPAVSAAYDIARDLDTPFSQLKVRASYGLTGNAGIGNFAPAGLVAFGNDYNMIPGFQLNQLENTELTWESARTFDVALDFTLANGFLDGSVGFYNKVSSDLLLDVPQPQTNGISVITSNAGEILNTGIEFNLNFNLVNKPDFQWNFNLNGATLRNEVRDLIDNNGDGEPDDITVTRSLARVGETLGSFFLIPYAGVDPANGDALFINAQGETTAVYPGLDARVIAGNPIPDFSGGFGSNVRFKGFDFSFFFQTSLGHQLYLNEGTFVENNLAATWNQRTTQLDAWTPTNTITNVPEARRRVNGSQASTRYLSDADYLRLRNVQLGYTFKDIGKAGNSARLYVSGANLLTFTDFAGLDPEASGQDVRGFAQGDIFFSRPQTKTVTFGFNLNF